MACQWWMVLGKHIIIHEPVSQPVKVSRKPYIGLLVFNCTPLTYNSTQQLEVGTSRNSTWVGSKTSTYMLRIRVENQNKPLFSLRTGSFWLKPVGATDKKCPPNNQQQISHFQLLSHKIHTISSFLTQNQTFHTF